MQRYSSSQKKNKMDPIISGAIGVHYLMDFRYNRNHDSGVNTAYKNGYGVIG